jgi:RNA polymerase sigma factor (sigma-70 family)
VILVEEWTQEVNTLFVTNRTQLCRAAYKILGDWERSDDVVQDAYIKIIEMTAAQNIRQPLAYMFQIVRNLAIDHYRRMMFESDLFGIDEEGLHVPSLVGMPETYAINREQLALVIQALACLPERTKRVFELYRVDGYTHRMIADELSISTSLANILIHEATNHCRRALQFSNAVKQ